MGRPFGSHRVDDLKQQADAIGEAAAVGIGPVVGERREEFVDQVAVGSMDLNKVEARGIGTAGRLGKGEYNSADAGLIQLQGNGILRGECDRAGSDGLPAAFVWREKALTAEEGDDMLPLRPA